MTVIKYKKKFRLKKIVTIKKKFLGLCQLGFYGIKAMSSGLLTVKQLETMRRVIVRITKRVGKVFIRVIFQHPLTAKSIHSRMGKGAGPIKNWVSFIKKGVILVEFLGIPKKLALEAYYCTIFRFPLKINFIEREVKISPNSSK